MDNRPNESIMGNLVGFLEIALQCYLVISKNEKLELAVEKAKATQILPKRLTEKANEIVNDAGETLLSFNGKTADEVKEVLLKKDLITDEFFKNVFNEEKDFFENNDLYFMDYEEDLDCDFER